MFPVPGSWRRSGDRRFGVDERLCGSAAPRHGGPRRAAGRGRSGGAPLVHSASASHTSHPRSRSNVRRGGAKKRRPKYAQRGGLLASLTGKRKGSPSQRDGHAVAGNGKRKRTPLPDLPEDILSHIHSLMPLREAARVACLSRAFLRSWRCHPKLIFNKDTIGLKSASGENFHHKITRVLRNHSGISLKTLEVDYSGIVGFDGNNYLDGWLQTALKLGVEELTLVLSNHSGNYKFPCSLLSDGVRNSLRYLKLHFCDLRPTVELGPLRSLTSLQLCSVRINWNELECILSKSLALEHLELVYCPKIICLKIPCALKRLNSLRIEGSPLKLMESKAPNLSNLLVRKHRLDFSRVETLQMKKLLMERTICDACVQLPSIMPNLETLVIESWHQVVDAPMLPTKFVYLKNLTIRLQSGLTISRPFDYLSLVSFLDASPSLETFILDVRQQDMIHESIFADSQLRDMPERRHGYLKSVEITGFSSAKSLAELTCYILENAVSLECLTLDTVYGHRCDQGRYSRCFIVQEGVLMDAPRAVLAIKTYIENKVPSRAKLTVLEPCSRCHARRNVIHRSRPTALIQLLD